LEFIEHFQGSSVHGLAHVMDRSEESEDNVMLPSPSDTRASLIVRLRDQEDRDAWDEVMAIYGPLVFRMALRQGLQRADAEDVVQQVFTAIFQSIEQWLEQSERGRFRNWLIGIGRNVSLNMLNRKPKGGIGVGGTEGHDMLGRLNAAEDELASEFDIEYRREVYRWAAQRVQADIDPKTWEAFRMSHVDGVSISEAAKLLGIGVGQVYVARSRVMKRLQNLVSQYSVVTDG
jgi:RNA polymerase sigma-70 factor, ECF subfamily